MIRSPFLSFFLFFSPEEDKDHERVSSDGNEHEDAEDENCRQGQMPRQNWKIPIFSGQVDQIVGIMFHHEVQSRVHFLYLEIKIEVKNNSIIEGDYD